MIDAVPRHPRGQPLPPPSTPLQPPPLLCPQLLPWWTLRGNARRHPSALVGSMDLAVVPRPRGFPVLAIFIFIVQIIFLWILVSLCPHTQPKTSGSQRRTYSRESDLRGWIFVGGGSLPGNKPTHINPHRFWTHACLGELALHLLPNGQVPRRARLCEGAWWVERGCPVPSHRRPTHLIPLPLVSKL